MLRFAVYLRCLEPAKLLGNEPPIPGQNGVRFGHTRNLGQGLAPLGFHLFHDDIERLSLVGLLKFGDLRVYFRACDLTPQRSPSYKRSFERHAEPRAKL